MTILIENPETLEYLQAENVWTKTAANGLEFSSTSRALATGKQQHIGKFNIVGFVAQTRQLISLDHGRGSGAAKT